MTMVVGNGSHIKELNKYLKRINDHNDFDLAWGWYPDAGDEPEIEIYEEAEHHVLCIALPDKVIETIKRRMTDWSLDDPDD